MLVLANLDYAEDIGFLPSKHQDAQQKAERLGITASTISLKVNTKMTQVLMKTSRINDAIMIDRKFLEDSEKFNYFGTNVTTTGEWNQEIYNRISKSNLACAMLKPVFRTSNLSVYTKIKIIIGNVLSVLLDHAECWKTTVTIR